MRTVWCLTIDVMADGMMTNVAYTINHSVNSSKTIVHVGQVHQMYAAD